jgi:ABC-type transporter MlaC component
VIRSPQAIRNVAGFLTLAALSLLPAATARADLDTEARAFLTAFHERVDAIVSDEATTPDQKRDLVSAGLDRHLDYGYLASSALGSRGKDFSREQFANFAREYSRFLADFFTVTIARSEPEPLNILQVDVAQDGQGGPVRARVQGKARRGYMPGAMRIPREGAEAGVMTYTLRKRGDMWLFRGVAFGGIDVSTTFRGQFDSFLKSKTPEELTAELARRNAKARDDNPFAR